MAETEHMRRALELAEIADGSVAPRPPVGAVVVAPSGQVVGEGFTQPVPGPHAEIVALRRAGEHARGGTLHVTLEPCSHSGATGPCTDRIVETGIRRVVAPFRDPNPEVHGRGFRRLREAGVEVRIGVLRESARRLIEPFTTWVTQGRSFVTLKLALTLDGRVAAPDGTSRWITGEESRADVHELRRRADAVAVGAGTVRADDPSLICRLPGYEGPQPRRVVMDARGGTEPGARVFDGLAPVTVVTTPQAPPERRAAWERAGADIVVVSARARGVDITEALTALGRTGACHLLVEGGPTLAASFIDDRMADRVVLYVAPKLLGDGPAALTGGRARTLTDAMDLHVDRVQRLGDDIRIEGRPRRPKEDG